MNYESLVYIFMHFGKSFHPKNLHCIQSGHFINSCIA